MIDAASALHDCRESNEGPDLRFACETDLLRPPKRGGEARYRRRQVLRVGGDDIQQLPREDGVDRLAVAVGEAFQGQDLETGDAHFQVGQAEELGDGVGEVGAEGDFDPFLRPEVHAEGGQHQKPETRKGGLCILICRSRGDSGCGAQLQWPESAGGLPHLGFT